MKCMWNGLAALLLSAVITLPALASERGPFGQRGQQAEPLDQDGPSLYERRGQRDEHRAREQPQESGWERRTTDGTERHRFSPDEQQQIERWYRERNALPSSMPNPSQGGLPPGLQRRLQRGGSLPPGWQRKVEPGMTVNREQLRYSRRVDPQLSEGLPEQPEGSVLIEMDEQVVRVIEATGEILDVFGIGR